MPTVTYKAQPGIHTTRGTVPVEGTSHPYTVAKILWPNEVESWISDRLVGSTLHVCCGHSQLGDVRIDTDRTTALNVLADAARIPFADGSFDTVFCDPPYNGVFQWMHDMLNELHRLARVRIIFQHWFSPINNKGQFKKAHVFGVSELVSAVEDTGSEVFNLIEGSAWMPRTYFGRMQFISVFDREAVWK